MTIIHFIDTYYLLYISTLLMPPTNTETHSKNLAS